MVASRAWLGASLVRAVVLRQAVDDRRGVNRARRGDDGDARLWQHRDGIRNALGVKLLRQDWMRVDAGDDEAGALSLAHGLQRPRRALNPAFDYLIVVVGADRLAISAEGDDVAEPVVAPGVMNL